MGEVVECGRYLGCVRSWAGLIAFCVHGIVVHLRLGNCIGYSLRESIPIDPFVDDIVSSLVWPTK